MNVFGLEKSVLQAESSIFSTMKHFLVEKIFNLEKASLPGFLTLRDFFRNELF